MPTFHPTLSDTITSDGTASIYILVTSYKQRAKVGTGLRVSPRHWNPKRKEVRSSHPDYDNLNKAIGSEVMRLQAIYAQALSKGQSLSAKEIKGASERGESDVPGFFAFCYEYLDRLEAAGKRNTMSMRRSIVKKFQMWLNVEEIAFNLITPVLIEKYIAYLRTINGPTTVHANIKRLKEQFNRANKVGVYDGNPFRNVSVPNGKANKTKLTVDEVKKIEALRLNGNAELARKVWLFSFYCAGIRISDMCRLKCSDIREGVLTYAMGKTGEVREIMLHEKALSLIDNFSGKWLFPLLAENLFGVKPSPAHNIALTKAIAVQNAKINKDLKAVAEAAGIEKRLTCHISRHTFADIARKKKLSTQVISELLGHSSIAITQAYFGSGFDDDTLDKAIREVVD